jgi:hypothetical protein
MKVIFHLMFLDVPEFVRLQKTIDLPCRMNTGDLVWVTKNDDIHKYIKTRSNISKKLADHIDVYLDENEDGIDLKVKNIDFVSHDGEWAQIVTLESFHITD